MAERGAGRRHTFGPVVLLGLASGALTAVAGNQRVVDGEGRAASRMSSLALTFDGHLPLVTALALVVLACWGVVLVTRGRVRRAVAALGAVAAASALAAVVVAYPRVTDDLREALAQVGVRDATVGHTGWYWVALVGALLATLCAVLAALWTPSWPEMGARYDAPGAQPGVADAAAEPPEEQSSIDLWKALDEGRDPTA